MTRPPSPAGRPVHVLPTSRAGRWSLALLGLSGAAAVTMGVIVGSGQRGGGSMSANLWITLPALVAVAGVAGALVGGLLATTWYRDRSVAVVLAIIVGPIVTLCLLGWFLAT